MNITNRYLGELEQIIAGEIDMWPFTRKKVEDLNEVKENVDGRFNQSRRDFLKSGAKGAVALTAMGAGGTAYDIATSILDKENKLTNDAHAYDFSKLPPGIANCRDKMVAIIYGEIIHNFWRLPDSHFTIGDRLNRRIGDQTQQIAYDTPYLEPAIYMLVEKDSVPGSQLSIASSEKLEEKNPALWHFKEGLNKYFRYWVHRNPFKFATSTQLIEKDFINSIFIAAYETPTLGFEEANRYINLETNEEKAVVLNGLMDRFSKMSKDKTSIDPKDGYNRCLVAAWSSFMLTVHYDNINDKSSLGKHYNSNLEKPLRNLKKDFHIRGPPHYNI